MRTGGSIGTGKPVEIERLGPADIAPVISPGHEIKALTGLRFIAACWVLTAHFQPVLQTLWPSADMFQPLARDGNMGVDLFFILSGFILIYNYRQSFRTINSERYLQFLGLRLARIYPVHLFTLGLFVAFVALDRLGGAPSHHEEGVFTLAGFVKHMFLVQSWGLGDSATWNQPAWSLSAEWFAYLFFPFLAWGLLRFGSVRLLTGAVIIGAPLGFLLLNSLETLPPFLPLLRISVTFTLGCLLGIAYLEDVGAGRRGWSAIATASVVGIVAASLLLPDTCCAEYGTVIPLMAVLIFSLARSTGPPASWLSSQTAMFWGGASYALYMTHWFVLAAGRTLLPPGAFDASPLAVRTLVVFSYLAALFGMAASTFMFIERPARRRLRDAMAAR